MLNIYCINHHIKFLDNYQKKLKSTQNNFNNNI